MHGVFIRAPLVSGVGPAAEILARDPDGSPVAVRQGRVLATAFHPELTGDRRMHRLLLEMIGRGAGRSV
jgi:5'-phosphate synthase pdxT subunit